MRGAVSLAVVAIAAMAMVLVASTVVDAQAGRPAAVSHPTVKPVIVPKSKAKAAAASKPAKKPAKKPVATAKAAAAVPKKKIGPITKQTPDPNKNVPRKTRVASHPSRPAYPPHPSPSALLSLSAMKQSNPALAFLNSADLASPASGNPLHRFAVVRRDQMRVAVAGWVSDFFSWFENAVDVLTAKVKAVVTQTVQAFEDRVKAVAGDVQALYTYFKNSKNIDKSVSDLWVNTRCDICQSALLHIYAQGCKFASQGICSIVDYVACGPFKPICDKVLCPLIQKAWLAPECANIQSRLDAVLLDKQTGTYSPLDNFNTLAVCKRVGLCQNMDSPFDSDLLDAIAAQSRALTASMNKDNDPVKAVAAATTGTSSVTIPSQRLKEDGFGYVLPGIGATISVYINNQFKDPNYGKPYYMFWEIESGGPASIAGLKEGWWLKTVDGTGIDALGPQGVIDKLSAAPGTTVSLGFEDSGWFSSSFPVKQLTIGLRPVEYASIIRNKK